MKPRSRTLIGAALGATILLIAASPMAAQKMTGSPAATGYRQEPGQPSRDRLRPESQ